MGVISQRISEGLKSHILSRAYDNDITLTGFGLASAKKPTCTNKKYDHFEVSSEPRFSKEEAYAYFWADYFRKVDKSKKYSDIYWRREPEYLTDRSFDFGCDKHIVRCRFSLSW